MWLVVILGLAVSIGPIGAQDWPLPDKAAFLAEARKYLQTDRSLQGSYMYVETRRESKVDRDGRKQEETVKVYESYPGLPGEPRWERLVSENGRPLPAAELADQDRDREQKASAMARRLETDPGRERARQQREWQQRRRERELALADVDIVFDVKMTGRESIEGHDTIAFSLTPRPASQPKTREGGLMKHFSVRAWISESEYELVRLEATALENMSLGYSVLARLHKGSRLSFLRRKINGEVWLPALASYSGSGRVGLLWTLRRTGTTEYSGYRKFSVETSFSVQPGG